MKNLNLDKKVLILVIAIIVVLVWTGAQAVVKLLDDMDNIAARPWVDERDTQVQARSGWMSQGPGVMKIDYGVTNDASSIPDPASGWDYLGNWIGVGGPGAAFTSAAGNNVFANYAGDFDRVPTAPFTFAELGILTTDDVITLDVFKTIANSPEHVRELQLYDGLGNRNTYSVQAEATARFTPQGWTTYSVPLSSPLENNADLTDIVTIKLWVSSWSSWVSGPGDPPVWPDDYTVERPTGTPVLIDNLRIESIKQVYVDIKPGSDPNSINCKNQNGSIPVAILSTADFDATTVDHTTVRFGKEGNEAAEIHTDKKTGEAKRHEEDVDGDGDTDLVFHFRFGDTGIECGDDAAILTGETFGGQAIEGSDAIRTVGGLNKPLAQGDEEESPESFALNQNYPNPFNPSTAINYQIAETGLVTLNVYDVLGKEVAILVNEEKPAGYYEVEFDATALPSGIYFYKLQAGSFVETKKMVLMK